MKNITLLLMTLFCLYMGQAQTVFINEFHYDNDGTDVAEAVEIAGPAGTNLTGWTLVLYNGANGTPYLNLALASIIPNQQNGYGTLSFLTPGMQDGAPDGMALVDNTNTVIQTIGYEGTFIGTAGPALGLVFQSLGSNNTEIPTTPVGFSLQLTGTGTVYSDFTWNPPVANTANAINNGQTFAPTGAVCTSAFSITCGDAISGTTTGGIIPSVTTCGTAITSPGVWYKYSSTAIGKITASTCGNANYDTKISIFRSDCSNLICVGGNDDGVNCTGFTSEITVDVMANEDYFILVHGFLAQTGNFVLSLDCGPRAVCQGGITTTLDTNGMASITAADIDAGSDSPNGVQSLSIDTTTFDCSNIGPNTVTLTVTDNDGQTDACTTIVTVEDNLAPTANTLGFLDVFLDANGQVTVDPMDVDFGSTDNCGIDTFALDVSTFDCSDLGINNVTLTVTDASGNSDTGTSILNVLDNLPPNIILQDITVTLDSNNQATITPASIDNGTTDNCSLAVTSINTSSFDCSNLGPNTVTFTAEDSIGNSSSATAVVTVIETTPPIATTQNITVSLDANGAISIVAADVDNGSTDNCAIDTIAIDISSFTCADLGANTVTLTVTDTSGNTSTATATVTVIDDTPPIAITQAVILNLDATGNATLTAADVDNGSSDNCAIQSLSINGPGTYSCADIGSFNVVLTVEDTSGNVSTASAPLTVQDILGPNIITQDITVNLDSNGMATISAVDIDNGSSDNCGIGTLSIDVTTFDCSDIGVNTVTLTVTDTNGNQASDTAEVTVIDSMDPMVITTDFTVSLDANGDATITPSDIDNGSTDNCGIGTLSLDVTSFDCSDIGANTLTLTVTDSSGNSASDVATLTVIDDLNPIAIGQDITVDLAGNSSVTILPSDVDDGTTDNCDFSLSLDQDTFTATGTFTVVLTAEDTSGNSDTTQVNVTVVDTLSLLDEAYSKQIKLYPNPGIAEINLESALFIEGVQVYDSSGKLIDTYGPNTMKINVTPLESGVYFLLFKTENGLITKRLIKE